MRGEKLTILFFWVLFLVGCTNNNEEVIAEYKKDIETKQDKINELEHKLEELKNDKESDMLNLQSFDRDSRKILQLIENEEYDKLRSDYHADFEINDGNITFKATDNASFPISIAGSFMHFAYYHSTTETTEVAYYLYDNDTKYHVIFNFNQDNKLEYIYTGGL